ncbi:dihydrofolate reductase family protein [Planococcus citreus]|uniref:dihydrofolate reductase family protein n=1 Tax=Planococcus citreus TaxID=1373 RepID=UPI001080A25A|nr:dihydrofolate reductase family protein [Planococcus citreus]
MAKVCFGMIVSLDGFVSDRHGKLDKLYESFKPNDEINEVMAKTGAVVMGRRTYGMTDDPDAYADDYEFQVPIFVLTHHPPAKHPKENDNLSITFVTDGIETAVRKAKAAAGEQGVVVLGADVGQQALRANLVDELQIAFAPLLIGTGTRMFEHLEDLEIQLEKVRTIVTDEQVEVYYKVIGPLS